MGGQGDGFLGFAVRERGLEWWFGGSGTEMVEREGEEG